MSIQNIPLNVYQLGGNSFGVTSELGTKDNEDLSLIANDVEVVRIDKGGSFHWEQTTDGSIGSIDFSFEEIVPGFPYVMFTPTTNFPSLLNSAVWKGQILLLSTTSTPTAALKFSNETLTKSADVTLDDITGNLDMSCSGLIHLFSNISASPAGQLTSQALQVTGGVPAAGRVLTDDGTGLGVAVWQAPQTQFVKITKTFADFATAATTNNIEIYSLPAGGIVANAIVKPTISFDTDATPVTGEVVGVGSQTPFTGESIGTGDGVQLTFPFTLANIPAVKTTISITDTVETFTENGNGILFGDMGGTGTINYTTGVGSVTFNTAPANTQGITADYSQGTYAFSFSLINTPLVVGSTSITDTIETFTDNSDGTLTGSLGGAGTIDYVTGAIAITFNNAPTNAQNITSDYSYQTSGTLTAYTISVGITGTLNKYANAYDVFQATGGTVFGPSNITIPTPEDFSTITSVRAAAVATGENLNQVGTGTVDIYLEIIVLPI